MHKLIIIDHKQLTKWLLGLVVLRPLRPNVGYCQGMNFVAATL